ESEELTKKTTENLLKRFEDVSKVISVLDSRVEESEEAAETVWRALSSPGGAGMFAEIGLENSLKSFGLEKGRDFLIQSQIEGKKLRPDAILFLPGNTVLVVDSKASKFLLELAEAEGTEEEEEAYKNLARTMNQHLTSLASKNYKEEIIAGYREAGRGDEIKRIMSIMYLPNEGAIDKIARGDPQFIQKAAKQEISVAGPAALTCLIGFARVEIDLGKRTENQEQIIELTQSLMDSVAIALDHTGRVGSGLKTASDNFVKLTQSINSRLLPRMRDIASKGVRPTRHKGLPGNLASYQLISAESENVIDGEAEEIGELPNLTGGGEDGS
ncbi:MAG: DNA recombination protein RmuC, partial [Rhodospirillales bacterium]|nr:DNA recombination protein RmuC [Rhodospirillales bacterium]